MTIRTLCWASISVLLLCVSVCVCLCVLFPSCNFTFLSAADLFVSDTSLVVCFCCCTSSSTWISHQCVFSVFESRVEAASSQTSSQSRGSQVKLKPLWKGQVRMWFDTIMLYKWSSPPGGSSMFLSTKCWSNRKMLLKMCDSSCSHEITEN